VGAGSPELRGGLRNLRHGQFRQRIGCHHEIGVKALRQGLDGSGDAFGTRQRLRPIGCQRHRQL